MRIPSLLVVFALLGSSAWAQDDRSRVYVQLNTGLLFSEEASDVPGGSIGFDPGYEVGVAVGYDMGDEDSTISFAPELELYYQYFTVDEDDLPAIPSAVNDDAKAFAFMLNGNLDWHITDQFTMYGALGVGWASVIEYDAWDSGNLSIDDSSGVAGQAKFGWGYNLGGSYDVRLGLRYFKTEPLDIDDDISGTTSEIDVGQFALEAGFRWSL